MSGSFNDLFNDLSKSIGLVTFDMMYELKPVFGKKHIFIGTLAEDMWQNWYPFELCISNLIAQWSFHQIFGNF